jgi:hypothetical protein
MAHQQRATTSYEFLPISSHPDLPNTALADRTFATLTKGIETIRYNSMD